MYHVAALTDNSGHNHCCILIALLRHIYYKKKAKGKELNTRNQLV